MNRDSEFEPEVTFLKSDRDFCHIETKLGNGRDADLFSLHFFKKIKGP
jgi:hypothetical protein